MRELINKLRKADKEIDNIAKGISDYLQKEYSCTFHRSDCLIHIDSEYHTFNIWFFNDVKDASAKACVKPNTKEEAMAMFDNMEQDLVKINNARDWYLSCIQ